MNKPTMHSYSSTGMFQTCPGQYQKIRWLKTYTSESNEAAERGTEMHDELEHCIIDDTDYSMPEYQWILDDFRAQTGLKVPEMELAINADWEPVPYYLDEIDDNGRPVRNPEAWYGGKVDLTCLNGSHANVSDLKTGKRKFKEPEDFECWLIERHEGGIQHAPQMLANARQASEYSLLIFLHFPAIKTLDFRFIWSDVEDCKEDLFKFSRDTHSEKLLKTMLATPAKIEQAIETDTWELKPSGLCAGWCPVLSCENWKPKRTWRR